MNKSELYIALVVGLGFALSSIIFSSWQAIAVLLILSLGIGALLYLKHAYPIEAPNLTVAELVQAQATYEERITKEVESIRSLIELRAKRFGRE